MLIGLHAQLPRCRRRHRSRAVRTSLSALAAQNAEPSGRRTSPCPPAPPTRPPSSARPRRLRGGDAPDPDDREVGQRGVDVEHRPHGHRMDGAAGQPAPAAAERRLGAARRRSTIPMTVLIRVTASAPASSCGTGDRDQLVGVRAQLRPDGPLAGERPRRARRRSPAASARRDARPRRGSDSSGSPRRRRPTSGASASMLRRRARSRRRAAPDARDDACSCALELRKVVAQPRRDARTLQADAVEHPARHRVQPRRWVARPLECGERLHDDRTELGERRSSGRARRRGPTCPTRSSRGSAARPTRSAVVRSTASSDRQAPAGRRCPRGALAAT